MTTINELKALFEELFEEELDMENIGEDSLLIDDIGMNSVGMLHMSLALEEQYDIEFKNSDFADLKTLGDVIQLVNSKL